MPEHVVGAQLYTLREFCKTTEDFAASMRKVAEIGYKAVQVSGIGPIDPKDVVRITDDNGLAIVSTHTGWPRFQTELDKVIEEHKLWKCRHAAIGGLPWDKGYWSIDGARKFADEVKPIAEKLTAAGMTFSYHNHAHELAKFDGLTWLERMYKLTADYVKVEIDTHWIQRGGGDPAAWIRKYPGRQPLLHLKDCVFWISLPEKLQEQRYAEVGEGNLNWPEILKAAKEAGVRWHLVEQDSCYGRDPFECLAVSYRNLNGMGLY